MGDFDTFLAAVEQPSTFLTAAREILDRATLATLDGQMRTHRASPGGRADQHRYPLLHLFQRICIGARLHRVEHQRGKLRMVPTENRAAFGELGPVERYFGLLEAAWVDMDWGKLGVPDHRCDARLDWLADQLVEIGPGEPVTLSSPFTGWTSFFISGDHVQALVLSFFGLLQVEPVPANLTERTGWLKGQVWLRRITVTDLGHAVLPRLAGERPWFLWNTPDRRSRGYGLPAFPGESLRPDDGGVQRPTPFSLCLCHSADHIRRHRRIGIEETQMPHHELPSLRLRQRTCERQESETETHVLHTAWVPYGLHEE